jgi:hypothetical protein
MGHDGGEGRQLWPDAKSFYEERDQRTELEVAGLHRYVYTPIEIHIDPACASDISVQRMALLSANLTARWARKIRISVPDVPLCSPLDRFGDKTLRGRIEREINEADPFGAFEIGCLGAANEEAVRLRIGMVEATRPAGREDYWIDVKGWSVLGRRGSVVPPVRSRNASAATAFLAGAIGAADVFKRAIGHRRDHWIGDVNWPTWDHCFGAEASGEHDGPVLPAIFDFGNVLLAGVGAVGSSFLYILGGMEFRSRMTLLDQDCVDVSNLNRSPLFSVRDAVNCHRKTDVGAAWLKRCGCEVQTLYGPWHEHTGRLSREALDVWISLTNEGGVWAELPFHLPPVTFHGTTTSGWGAAVGRHIPRVEDCTACRLPRPQAEFRGPCAEGNIALSENHAPVRASLPFLSAVSAALLVTELQKLEFDGAQLSPNAVFVDFRHGLPTVIARAFGANNTCPGCRIVTLPRWMNHGGRGRYVSLSQI